LESEFILAALAVDGAWRSTICTVVPSVPRRATRLRGFTFGDDEDGAEGVDDVPVDVAGSDLAGLLEGASPAWTNPMKMNIMTKSGNREGRTRSRMAVRLSLRTPRLLEALSMSALTSESASQCNQMITHLTSATNQRNEFTNRTAENQERYEILSKDAILASLMRSSATRNGNFERRTNSMISYHDEVR